MLLLKRFSHNLSHAKFRGFRKAHAVFAALFFLSFLAGIVLGTRYLLSEAGIDSAETFAFHWKSRIEFGPLPFALYGFWPLLAQLLVAMVFGITVYAPLTAGISSLVSAFVLGAYWRFLLGLLHLSHSYFTLFYYSLWLLPTALVLLFAFAFSAVTSFRIFTPFQDKLSEEEQLFGGTLFCAPYFQNVINLRFLFSYLAVFFVLALLCFSICLGQAAMVLYL